MREMGGLASKMPITFGVTVVGALALCGVPPLSGFFSKDAVLGAAALWGLEHGGWRWAPFALGIVGAGMTAFYMTRAVALVFLGEPRDRHRHDHAHEAPASMWVPLVVLAVFAACAGWVQGGYERLIVMPGAHGMHDEDLAHHAHVIAMWSSLAVAAVGIGGALLMHRAGTDTRDHLPAPVSTTLERLYWVDEIYEFVLVRPCVAIARALGWLDRVVVDSLVDMWGYATRGVSAATGWLDREALDAVVIDGVARTAREAGGVVRRVQTGRIQDYGLGLAGGVAAASAAIFFLLGR
jgi:NADH-quinone oxidoreductase subunit L